MAIIPPKVVPKAIGALVVILVAQLVLPSGLKPARALRLLPAWVQRVQPLETVTLDQAANRVVSTHAPNVAVLYLTLVPDFLREELSRDMKIWQTSGATVHAFAIDAPGERYEVPVFVRDAKLNVKPVWIRMPGGDECALEQLRAVSEFTGQNIGDPTEVIPLLTLVLRDGAGKVVSTKFITVPNGEGIDPQELQNAIAPFDLRVRRLLR